MQDIEFKMLLNKYLTTIKSNFEKIISPITQEQGLTTLQTMVLYEIKRGSISNISDVSKVLCIEQGNASSMCKRLAKEGFVLRKRSLLDERKVELVLTEKAINALKQIKQNLSIFEDMLDSLSDEKKKTIIDSMFEVDKLVFETLQKFENNT